MVRPGLTDSVVCRAKGEMLVTMGTKSSGTRHVHTISR